MFFRTDKLLTALPKPRHPSADAASAVQELMGGKAGEMSTLMNYFFQSMNYRGRETKAMRPYYQLISNIVAEEWGHVELVGSAINLLLTGSVPRGGRRATPTPEMPGPRRPRSHRGGGAGGRRGLLRSMVYRFLSAVVAAGAFSQVPSSASTSFKTSRPGVTVTGIPLSA